jgi:uncharacterized protein (TIGR02757 family)
MANNMEHLEENSNLHKYLDCLVEKYKTPDFIKNDPIKFPYKYDDYNNRELMAFISSMMAQGKRTTILSSIEKLELLMNKNPYDFITNFDYDKEKEKFSSFSHFAYKNIHGNDILSIFYLLQQLLHKYKNLKELFLQGLDTNKHKNIKEALTHFIDMFFSFEPPLDKDYNHIPNKVKSLLPNPRKGSACKRLNMFLRWVVRKDNVDLGLWTEVPTSMLIIPLDFHVSKLSRELGLTKRNQDNWITAEEITDNLKKFDSNDPTKYDFAIFGMGVSGDKIPSTYRY